MTVVHEIDVREQGSRARVRATPRMSAEGRLALGSAGHCVVFIHGFANSHKAAARKYETMQSQLVEFTGGDGWRDEQVAYFGFHWPGNHAIPVINQLTFATRISTADNAGGVLARWLQAVRPVGDVTLVAHSLGCRAALSCAGTLMSDPLIVASGGSVVRLRGVVLMAGAVRRQECEPTSDVFGAAYPEARYTVMYSYYDAVLITGFAAGQMLVDRPGRAIGRYGEPVRGRWHARLSTNLGHGGYWSSELAGQNVAENIRLARTSMLASVHAPQAELGVVDLGEVEVPSHRLGRDGPS